MLKEFREFALRGNLVDLAVAFILGVAFSKVVASLVADVLMPPLGRLLGRVDFSNLFISLSGDQYPSLAAAKAAGAATLNYGLFLNTIIEFLIVAFALFLIIKQVNRLRGPAPTTKECPYCQMPIPLKATRCPNCTSALATA